MEDISNKFIDKMVEKEEEKKQISASLKMSRLQNEGVESQIEGNEIKNVIVSPSDFFTSQVLRIICYFPRSISGLVFFQFKSLSEFLRLKIYNVQ